MGSNRRDAIAQTGSHHRKCLRSAGVPEGDDGGGARRRHRTGSDERLHRRVVRDGAGAARYVTSLGARRCWVCDAMAPLCTKSGYSPLLCVCVCVCVCVCATTSDAIPRDATIHVASQCMARFQIRYARIRFRTELSNEATGLRVSRQLCRETTMELGFCVRSIQQAYTAFTHPKQSMNP